MFNRGYVSAIRGQEEIGSSIKRVEIMVDHGKINVTGTEDAKLIYDGKFRFGTPNTRKMPTSKPKKDGRSVRRETRSSFRSKTILKFGLMSASSRMII
ncbi:hypothetical protein VQ056_25850 [Paenibacillus sp. JTLBN-2024]